jgi:choline dehydrogenase-like flavoprotein
MATKLNKRTVVIVGGGLTAALVARQLTAKGTDVLVLERGADRRDAAAAKLPNCLVPGFDGASLSSDSRDALWARFFTGAPQRQRRSVERYNIVKRA